MRLLKLASLSFIILFVITTCIGLLLPSVVVVSRTTEINAPKDTISIYTHNLLGWKKWVQGMENIAIINPKQATVGRASIRITTLTDSTLNGSWIERNGDEQQTDLYLFPSSNKTVVNWQFSQKVKWYPWARFSSMINEKVIGGMMETNLANLKRVVEQR